MSSSGSSRMRRLSPRGSALAVVAGGVLVASTLAGCGAGKTSSAASSSAPSSAASSATKASDLARGLLPAQAFGADAAVSTLTVQQLQQGTGMAGGSLQGAQITPEACAALVRSTHPGGGDKLSGAAAEVARQGTSTTAEVLAVSDEAKTLVSAVDAAIGTCPQVQVTAPSLGTATISFSTFDVPKLGDGSAGIAFTTVATVPGGQQVSVPALLGLAVDGKRLVTLVTADPGGAAPDQAAFVELLKKAFSTQSDALD